jgi:hypothetical protein
MKHAKLRSVAHNFADSLACGHGFVIGYCPTDIFGEAGSFPEGYLTVDFLAGTILEGQPSTGLAQAMLRYRKAFPAFCEKHGALISDFRELTVRYSGDRLGRTFVVTVEDARGRRSSSEYGGIYGKGVKVLDRLGRPRPKVSYGR